MHGSTQQLPPENRASDWERLRALLTRIDQRGLTQLSEQELWELPSLYRRTLSDLSLLRSHPTAPGLVQELSQLCNRAHAVIYRGVTTRRGPGLWYVIVHELPKTVRHRAGYILATAVIMLLFAIIAWFNCVLDRNIAEATLSTFAPDMLREWQTGLQAATELQDLRLAAQIDPGERGFAAVAITFNNIKVGAISFVLGILGGLPTIILIAFNGYLLGAITYLYFATPAGIPINLPLYFLAGILPHGSIELPAICLAGAGGLMLGFAWLFPGQRPRGESLRRAARDAGRLVVVCSLTLIVAGLIEGFITPLNPPSGMALELWFWLKIAFGTVVFSLWLSWLLAGGRRLTINPSADFLP